MRRGPGGLRSEFPNRTEICLILPYYFACPLPPLHQSFDEKKNTGFTIFMKFLAILAKCPPPVDPTWENSDILASTNTSLLISW